MSVFLCLEEDAPLLQQVDDDGIRLFEEHPGDRGDGFGEVAIQADAVYDRQVVGLAQRQIIHAVSGGDMDDAGAVLCAYEVGGQDTTDIAGRIEVIEKAVIVTAHQVTAFDRLDEFEVFLTQY